jgi:hypothetical protein
MPSVDVRTQTNIAMLGEGFYSRVSKGPKAVIDNARDLMLAAVDRIPVSDQVFLLADYGAADGGTSADLVEATLRRVRHRSPERPLSVHYTDLPGADFGTLFRNLDGADGYPTRLGGTSVFASGRSFYRQIIPSRTLQLGFSASAMHYLSSMPGIIEDHVHSVGASAAEQLPFRNQSMRDWEAILFHRAHELAPGGRLVFAVFCVDEQGRYLGNTTGQNMFDNYASLWASMRDEGIITAGESRRTAFQQHYKSIDETLEPFNDPASPVQALGLTLESAETRLVRCPFRAAFEAGDLDRAQFASEFVNTHRSWTETTFRAGLDATRSPADQQHVLDELYRRYEALVLEDPAGHGKDLLHLYVVATRR